MRVFEEGEKPKGATRPNKIGTDEEQGREGERGGNIRKAEDVEWGEKKKPVGNAPLKIKRQGKKKSKRRRRIS